MTAPETPADGGVVVEGEATTTQVERPAAVPLPRAAIPAAIDALRAGRARDRVDWRTEARRLAGDLEHAHWLLRALQDRCDGYQRTVEAQDRQVYTLTREVETLRKLRREQPVAGVPTPVKGAAA